MQYWFYLLCAWLIPGSGHFLLGQKTKGILLFLLVVPTYILGVYMIDFSIYFLAQKQLYLTLSCFIGLPMSIFIFASSHIGNNINIPPYLQTGFLYIAVSSLLNILLCFRVFMELEKRKWIG